MAEQWGIYPIKESLLIVEWGGPNTYFAGMGDLRSVRIKTYLLLDFPARTLKFPSNSDSILAKARSQPSTKDFGEVFEMGMTSE